MAATKKLKICMVASEMAPFAKTGGLADVTAALRVYLHDAGHQVVALLPRYPRVDKVAGKITPVPGLQDLTLQLGLHSVPYSIDKTMVPGRRLPVYLLRCPPLFGREGIYTDDGDEHLRFAVLSRAAIELCQHLKFSPDIFHCNDWHTALVPLYLKAAYSWDQLFRNTRSVLTIHNIGYQGMFAAEKLPDLGLQGSEHFLHQDDLLAGRVNFLKTGILYADLITAVSPTNAREMQGSEYGMGLDELMRKRDAAVVGILNGVDYREWNPATDKLLPANYSPDDMSGKAICKQTLLSDLGMDVDPDRPLIGIVTRLVGQKGISLMEETLPWILGHRNFSLAVLGSGESRYEQFFSWLQGQFPGRVCFYRGYNEPLAHQIEAGSDMFLMPSLYEPCGLNQMYSLKYGTIPIVRETGGLADSVQQVNAETATGTGVLFRDYNSTGLAWAINRALDLYKNKPLWSAVQANGMAMDYSWENQANHYVDYYRRLSNRA